MSGWTWREVGAVVVLSALILLAVLTVLALVADDPAPQAPGCDETAVVLAGAR